MPRHMRASLGRWPLVRRRGIQFLSLCAPNDVVRYTSHITHTECPASFLSLSHSVFSFASLLCKRAIYVYIGKKANITASACDNAMKIRNNWCCLHECLKGMLCRIHITRYSTHDDGSTWYYKWEVCFLFLNFIPALSKLVHTVQ